VKKLQSRDVPRIVIFIDSSPLVFQSYGFRKTYFLFHILCDNILGKVSEECC